MAVVLAFLSAIAYGVSDYLGGRTSRRMSPIAVTFLSELIQLVVFGCTIPLLEEGGPTAGAVGWGMAAGVSGSLGVLGLYATLSRGGMTVVAPVTGVVAAVLPVVVGIALGERPGTIGFVGILAAIVAVAMIGGIVGMTAHRVAPSTVALAVAVGVGFGILFIAYSRAGADAGSWPLLTSRFGGAPLLAAAYAFGRRRGDVAPVSWGSIRPSVVIGLVIGLSNGLYLASTRRGLLSVVAVIVSLYPASTIALAIMIDGERASRSQCAGMLLAAVGVALITVGS